MPASKKPELYHEPPVGLLETGLALWVSYASEFQLQPNELRWLEDACRLSDIMAALREAAVGQPLLTKGSTGQDVLNPLIAEQKTHASTVGSLLARIKLPADGAGVAVNQNRAAATSSWAPTAHRSRGA
jgi:hypothetical protein